MRCWQQVWQMAAPYWLTKRAGLGLVLLIVLSIMSSSFLIWETLQRGELLSALAAQDQPRFLKGIGWFLIIIIFNIPSLSFRSYLQDKLANNWRYWLTNHLRHQYFTNRAFYHIGSEIDNPDQRIAEDIRNLTQQGFNLLIILFDSIVQFFGFVAVLWAISKSLLTVLLIYAVVGTVVTTLIFGRVLVTINNEQLKREADFRYGLVRIRENAESIAFYQGQRQDYQQVQQRFLAAIRNFNRLIRWQLNLSLFQNSYQYITFILPFIVLAPRLFAGELEIGVISQSQAAFERIGLALGLVMTQLEQLSAMVAGLDRLTALNDAINALPAYGIKPSLGSEIALQQVTISIPATATPLIQNLSITVTDQSLLIVGASGVGKSSLLRTIAGLWHSGSGEISCPPAQHLLFLPQRPYVMLGSLRQQLLYPNLPSRYSPSDIQIDSRLDKQLTEYLQQVELTTLLDRWGLNATEDWSKLLSLGEQQRLAFARLLLTQPDYALLDEATSALDETAEARLYALLQATATTFISVGHRPTLLNYHQQVLELKSDHTWQLKAAADFPIS